ncbi:MAG: pyridoxamine 5'-phosphate oxidase [Gloeobacteraceae cyanobacterium ES-bin-316]|nr:pyridoxamine 5'-phosphate oxidase [Ferruginibacter sp.]
MTNIAAIRKDYMLQTLNETAAEQDAFKQFGKWWQDAVNSSIDEVNAFTLATSTLEGKPSARIVLLKGYDENGFVFFTNYASNKGNELARNPQACMVFFWKELERQIKIEGSVEKVSSEESDDYFASRPEGSRIGAWASPQSAVIENREVIEQNALKYQQQFTGQAIPRPKHWGGFRIKPTLIEFWQGRPSRLHDRLQFTLLEGAWKIERLAP